VVRLGLALTAAAMLAFAPVRVLASPSSEPGGAVSATPDSTPDDTAAPDTSPIETPPIESTPATTPTSAPATTAVDGDPVDTVADAREENVSVWWWVAGGVAAAAAVYGIAYSIRRRRTVEDWANEASLMCDTGRAMSATLTTALGESTAWSEPDRYAGQQRRFTAALEQLSHSAPNSDFATLLAGVALQDAALRAALAACAEGQPIDVARREIEPVLDSLADALSALENEASITVFGTALPSARPSG
jgi:hypothetical protein